MMSLLLILGLSLMAGLTVTGWLASLTGFRSHIFRFGAGAGATGGSSYLLTSTNMIGEYLELAMGGRLGGSGVFMILALLFMVGVWVFNLLTSEGEVMIR